MRSLIPPKDQGCASAEKYPQELRERAMLLVQKARERNPSLPLNAAVVRIGTRVGVNADTLRGWVKEADIDAGHRPGTSADDAKRIKDLEHGVKELKRELDPRRLHGTLGMLTPVEFETPTTRSSPERSNPYETGRKPGTVQFIS